MEGRTRLGWQECGATGRGVGEQQRGGQIRGLDLTVSLQEPCGLPIRQTEMVLPLTRKHLTDSGKALRKP